MTQTATHYLADHDRACRTCGGTGTERYPSGRGTTIIDCCDDCGGSGSHCVALKPVAHGTGDPDSKQGVDLSESGSFEVHQITKERTQRDSLLRSHPEASGL